MPFRALLRLLGEALGDARVLALEDLPGADAELGLVVVGPRDAPQVAAPDVVFARLVGALEGRAQAIVALRNPAPLLPLVIRGLEIEALVDELLVRECVVPRLLASLALPTLRDLRLDRVDVRPDPPHTRIEDRRLPVQETLPHRVRTVLR
jgi:hypothetical protein